MSTRIDRPFFILSTRVDELFFYFLRFWAIKPKETIPFSEEYEVVITFLRPKDNKAIEKDDIAKRLAIAESLFGILPQTVTDMEVKEERLVCQR